jgi:hypothetical protein
MSFLTRVRDGFWSYVSPRKTQAQRDKPFKAPAGPSARVAGKKALGKSVTASARRSMSPDSRIKNWQAGSSSTSRYQQDAPVFEPMTPASLRRPSHSLSPDRYPNVTFEGDTLIEEEEIYDANDETIVVTEDQLQEGYIDVEAERKRWDQKAQAQREEGWSEHAIEIFRKIGMRGYEPLLPSAWKLDFPTLPAELFSDDEEEVFINTACKGDFRGKQIVGLIFARIVINTFLATRALQNLLLLGARIRDARDHRSDNRGPQDAARRGIEAYMKWAQLDGGVDGPDDINILVLETGSKKVAPAELQESMVHRMEEIASIFRATFLKDDNNKADDEDDNASNADSIDPPSEASYVTELPTLYGAIASHTIVALVAYNIAAPQPALQIIAVLDYGDVHYEVWNSLALAALCIHSRNKMMELKPFLSTGESDYSNQSDPDA